MGKKVVSIVNSYLKPRNNLLLKICCKNVIKMLWTYNFFLRQFIWFMYKPMNQWQ